MVDSSTQSDRFVVKVQISLGGNEPESVLIYNEDQSVYHRESDPASVKAVKHALNGHPKAFFNAYLNEEQKLVLEDVADWQVW